MKRSKNLTNCRSSNTLNSIKLIRMHESIETNGFYKLNSSNSGSTETTDLTNKRSSIINHNPAFVDDIQQTKSPEESSALPTTTATTNDYSNQNEENDEAELSKHDETADLSVCYDNKDEIIKSFFDLKLNNSFVEIRKDDAIEHNDVDNHYHAVSNKNSCNSKKGKLKTLFHKKSKSLKNYTLSKFNSIKNDIEEVKTEFKKPEVNHYIVEIRVVFYKVGEIDTLNEKFYAEAFIEASWIDPNLDSKKAYNPKEHWNPELLILNSIGVLKEEIWYSQTPFRDHQRIVIHHSNDDLSKADCACTKMCELNEIKQTPGCLVIERRRVNGMFWQLLNLKDFPSDVQNLTLTISTAKHSSEISLLHSREKYSSVNVNCFLDHQEWHLYKHVKVKEFLRESVFSSETFPSVDLTICVARRPTYYYLNAFFLIFLITISSFTVFSMNCNLPQNRLQTGCTLLLTSVTFKWVTNRSLPTVSYMTSLDKYSLGCIIIVCLECIWHGIIGYLVHGPEATCPEPYGKFDFIAFLVLCCLFFLLNVSFMILFIRIGFCKRRKLNRFETDYVANLVGKRVTRLKSMLDGI